MREVFLNRVDENTSNLFIGTDEAIVGHTNDSIIVENKMTIFYDEWNNNGYEDVVGSITDEKIKLIGDLDRVITYLNSKYDGKPYRIIPTDNDWKFVEGLNIPSFLSPIKEEAICILCSDYKFLLDKLHKNL